MNFRYQEDVFRLQLINADVEAGHIPRWPRMTLTSLQVWIQLQAD